MSQTERYEGMAHHALGAEALDIECAEAAGLGTAGAERSEVPQYQPDCDEGVSLIDLEHRRKARPSAFDADRNRATGPS